LTYGRYIKMFGYRAVNSQLGEEGYSVTNFDIAIKVLMNFNNKSVDMTESEFEL